MGCGGVRRVLPLLALALWLAAPSVAKAAAAEGDESTDILARRFDLGVWTVVTFGLLYVVLRYVTLPGAPAPAFVMMLEGLKKREERIQSALAEAQRTREEAQRLREDMQQEMNRAQQRVRDMLDEGRRDAERSAQELVTKARAEITEERSRLHRELETAKDQALQELWERTVTLATEVSAKAIRRQVSPEDHRRLVDEALAELKERGKPNGKAGAHA